LAAAAASLSSQIQKPMSNPTTSPALKDMLLGALGFTGVGLVAFGIWALGGQIPEVQLYLGITVAFLVLAGVFLIPILPGPKKLGRFYLAFVPGFLLYAALWCAGWFGMAGAVPFALGHFTAGELLGSAAGLAAMAGVFCAVYKMHGAFLPVFAVMYLFHTLGYTLGGTCYYSTYGAGVLASLLEGQATLGRFLWGGFYGAGIGAGLGYALHRAKF